MSFSGNAVASTTERLHPGQSFSYVWRGLKEGQAGSPVELDGSLSLHAQVMGVLGAGKVVVEGSNVKEPQAADWALVVDKIGVPVEFNSISNFRVIDSIPRWLRPVASGDDAMTIDVLIMVRSLGA